MTIRFHECEHDGDLVADKIRLKEQTYLKNQITGIGFMGAGLSSYYKVDLWWDLDNHVMWAFGKEIIENLKLALIEVREYKKAENQEGWF